MKKEKLKSFLFSADMLPAGNMLSTRLLINLDAAGLRRRYNRHSVTDRTPGRLKLSRTMRRGLLSSTALGASLGTRFEVSERD